MEINFMLWDNALVKYLHEYFHQIISINHSSIQTNTLAGPSRGEDGTIMNLRKEFSRLRCLSFNWINLLLVSHRFMIISSHLRCFLREVIILTDPCHTHSRIPFCSSPAVGNYAFKVANTVSEAKVKRKSFIQSNVATLQAANWSTCCTCDIIHMRHTKYDREYINSRLVHFFIKFMNSESVFSAGKLSNQNHFRWRRKGNK